MGDTCGLDDSCSALWTERCDLTSAETLHAEAGCAFILTPPGHKSSADQILLWVECSGLWGWGQGWHTPTTSRDSSGHRILRNPRPICSLGSFGSRAGNWLSRLAGFQPPFQHLPCSVFLEYMFLSFIENV